MKLPNLVIVGAAKCGTTALWYNLDKHPDVSMALKSKASVEMNFWAGTKYKKGIEWYKERFEDTKIRGEKTVEYIMRGRSFKLMQRFIPDTKLILCVRNPVDRAYSNHQMHKKAGRSNSFTFENSVRRYSTTGKYMNLIEKNILPHFDKEQLYVCVTERMKDNPNEEMKKVFSFLNVDDLDYPKKIIDGVLLKNRSRLEDVAKNKKEKYYRVWSKHQDKLTGPLRNQLLKYYEPFNDRLFDFLGYKIEEWKT